ncbi:MAG: hypothetical protein IT306_12225 [Chloroflexi bacterium]|nr:hypothetical protein [Chloroflexota bacterium]
MLIVPIRHHSPAAALHVGRLIRERRPRVVLIEGPSDATDLIEQLTDPATRPPVAVYAYQRQGEDVRAAYYPFCAYSPEYVAMTAGREVGAEVRFCDLPTSVTLAWQVEEAVVTETADDGETAGRSADSLTPRPPTNLTPQPVARRDHRLRRHHPRRGEGEDAPLNVGYAEYMAALAEAAGFGSFEAFWEAGFEQEAGSGHSARYVELMTAFGAQARELLSGRDRGYDDARERAMAAAASASLSRGIADADILLVCGAAHAGPIAAAYASPDPVLPPDAGELSAALPSPEPAAEHPEPTAAQLALIPYSYPRLSEQAGYGAGNRAPWYYQQVWERNGDYAAATRSGLVVLARHLRRRGHGASVAQAIDAQTLAATLAAMRDKQAPGVDELVDAAIACFGQGHGDVVSTAIQGVLIGDAVGRVTGRAGRTPLQDEFYATVDRLRLPLQDTPKIVLVHLAGNAAEAEQSVLFHRLRALGVPFASEQASGLGGQLARGPLEQLGRVRERWEVQWSPATDGRLIERTAWGSTLAEATGRVLRERLDGAQRVDSGTEALLQMALCDLAESPAFGAALARCESLAADSGSFPALARATYHLDGLLAYGAARKLPSARLLDLARRLFARAVLHLPAATVCADEAADEVRTTLVALHELVQRRSNVVAGELDAFWEAIASVAERPASNPMLRGLALVLLELGGRLADGDLTARLRYWLSSVTDAVDNARLVSGLFVLHRATLVRNRALVGAVTEFLAGLELEQLTPLLPVLRRSLGNLSGPERVYLSETLGALLGLSATTAGRALQVTSTDRAWLEEADRAVAATLQDWKDRYGIGA